VEDGACSPSLVNDAAKGAVSPPSLEEVLGSLSPKDAAPGELENLIVSPSLVEDAAEDEEEDACSLAPKDAASGELENLIVQPAQPPHLPVRKSTRVRKIRNVYSP